MKNRVKIAVAIASAAALLSGCATTKPADTPDEQFKAGEKYFQKGNYDDAIIQWKKVKESYQSQELTTQAELGIANSHFLNGDYIEAAAAYDDFRKMHPKHDKAGFALYRQGLSHFNQVKGIDTDQTPVKNALVTLESYIKLYPGGEHTAEVKEKIALCRDKQLQYEIYVGRFYLRNNHYPAAIGRFDLALKSFPEAPRLDEVLYYLGKAYLEDNQKPRAVETFGRLVREFPNSAYRKKVPIEVPVTQAAPVTATPATVASTAIQPAPPVKPLSAPASPAPSPVQPAASVASAPTPVLATATEAAPVPQQAQTAPAAQAVPAAQAAVPSAPPKIRVTSKLPPKQDRY